MKSGYGLVCLVLVWKTLPVDNCCDLNLSSLDRSLHSEFRWMLRYTSMMCPFSRLSIKNIYVLTLCSINAVWICLAVIQGAGGMQMIDPLFQRILVKECQYRKIPVIFDEVFTGFWRLGAEVGCTIMVSVDC